MPGNLIMSTGWPYYILPPVQQSGAYNTKYMIQTCTTCFCVPFSSMISEHFLFLISTTPTSLDHILGVISTTLLRKVPRLTSCGSQAGDQCLLKGGIFLFRLAQLKIGYGWWSMAHYLELNRSQDAPKHCPTFDSLTQCFANANFRSPPILFATIFHHWFTLSCAAAYILCKVSEMSAYILSSLFLENRNFVNIMEIQVSNEWRGFSSQKLGT